MKKLAACDRPEVYYLRLRSLPILALPWWMEQSVRGEVDRDFGGDLVYATMNMYYYCRLLDDVMDAHGHDPLLLPALGVFHLEFHGTYYRHFTAEHPFWDFFKSHWKHSAEVASVEASLESLDETAFITYAAEKTVAVKLPLTAVAHRYGELNVLRDWLDFWDVLARWHQMRDDLLDWNRDLAANRLSYLLSEAKRKSNDGEGTGNWFAREGFDWAVALLSGWMDEMKARAARLNSPELERYLRRREKDLAGQLSGIPAALKALAAISRLSL
jgi:hypothetical protein